MVPSPPQIFRSIFFVLVVFHCLFTARNRWFNLWFALLTLRLSEKRCTTRPSMEQQSFSSKTMLALPNGSPLRRESRISWGRIRSPGVRCPHLVPLQPVPETKTPNRPRNEPLGVKTTAVLLTRLHRTQQTFRHGAGRVDTCMHVCSWERVCDWMRGITLRCWV